MSEEIHGFSFADFGAKSRRCRIKLHRWHPDPIRLCEDELQVLLLFTELFHAADFSVLKKKYRLRVPYSERRKFLDILMCPQSHIVERKCSINQDLILVFIFAADFFVGTFKLRLQKMHLFERRRESSRFFVAAKITEDRACLLHEERQVYRAARTA